MAAFSLFGLEMMPAVEILWMGFAAGIKQEFPIAFSAQDRTLDDISPQPLRFDGRPNAIAGRLMQCGLAHDSAFADLAPLHFKLRLDQQDHLAVRGEQRHQRGDQKRERDEADVGYNSVE